MSSNGINHGTNREYLTFYIGGDEYAVALHRVREVIQYDTLTRVPNVPVAIRGVTNLRGSVVPVIDLALKFGRSETAITRKACIVLVEIAFDGAPCVLGLVTEEVGQVLALSTGDVLPPPSFGAPVRTDYLLGLGRLEKKFVLLLDLDRVLSPVELGAAAKADQA